MIDVFRGLNEQQKAAVTTTEGPVLMLAGAGSGKTKALTHRLAYLVYVKKVNPVKILAVTFTNKAASEMRSRILKLLDKPESQAYFFPYLGTFHSIAVKILRKEAISLGYSTNFVIYDEADSMAVIKSLVRSLGLDEKIYHPRAILSMISSAKSELIKPHEYSQLAFGNLQKVAVEIYPLYQQELKKAAAFDFDDLIMKTVELFETNALVLKKYQDNFKYILVDEYQDTNNAQYRMIRLLTGSHQNICVVGDDWQSIYSWRGANFQNILNFETDYPNAKVIKLEQNYRSTQNILDAAHSVITKNVTRSEKKLWTNQQAGPKIIVEQVVSEVAEGQMIIQTIHHLMDGDPQLKLADFAVLYRTNVQSRSLEESFLRHNTAYKIVGGVRFYERKEIKDGLSFLRFIYSPDDLVSFNRIINLPPRGLGERSLQLFTDHFRSKPMAKLLDVLEKANDVHGLTARAAKALADFGEQITFFRTKLDTLSVSDYLEFVLKRSGYFDFVDDGTLIGADRIENLKELIGVAKMYDKLTLADFLAEIALITDLDNYSTETDAVTLMTLHAAKGLEFECVFIVGMEEGIFPNGNRLLNSEELEEERRLCYVGMTRARHWLYMVSTSSRLLYGTTQHNPPSRFLLDIPLELQQDNRAVRFFGLGAISDEKNALHPPDYDFKAGDKVAHDQFGSGIVTHVNGEEIRVAFSGLGEKRLNVNFAPLKKVPF